MKSSIIIILILTSVCVSNATGDEVISTNAVISISTIPDGASVFINDVNFGEAPINDISLAPGLYEISVREENYVDTSSTVNLSNGDEQNFILRLSQGKSGKGKIHVKPFSGSTFWIPAVTVPIVVGLLYFFALF